MIDITYVVVLVILLLSALAGKVLVPLIKANISAKDREKILFWTEIAVKAAEQLAKTGVIEREDRKEHVITFLQNHNITVDLEVIKEVMEACVNDLPSMLTDKEKKEIQGNLATVGGTGTIISSPNVIPAGAAGYSPMMMEYANKETEQDKPANE